LVDSLSNERAPQTKRRGNFHDKEARREKKREKIQKGNDTTRKKRIRKKKLNQQPTD